NQCRTTSGVVKTADRPVSCLSRHAGSFQIRAASHATGTALSSVYPRIMTPNGDGWNDKTLFVFDNPTLANLTGKIFDISGALVSELKAGPIPPSNLQWDGEDSRGKTGPGVM